jgi:uncharacterized membrane protein
MKRKNETRETRGTLKDLFGIRKGWIAVVFLIGVDRGDE